MTDSLSIFGIVWDYPQINIDAIIANTIIV